MWGAAGRHFNLPGGRLTLQPRILRQYYDPIIFLTGHAVFGLLRLPAPWSGCPCCGRCLLPRHLTATLQPTRRIVDTVTLYSNSGETMNRSFSSRGTLCFACCECQAGGQAAPVVWGACWKTLQPARRRFDNLTSHSAAIV